MSVIVSSSVTRGCCQNLFGLLTVGWPVKSVRFATIPLPAEKESFLVALGFLVLSLLRVSAVPVVLRMQGASSARHLYVHHHSRELDPYSHCLPLPPFPERFCNPLIFQQRYVTCKGNRHRTGDLHVCQGLCGCQQLVLSWVLCH